MKQIRRIKVEVEVNVLPHEAPKEVVDRVGRIFAYYTGSGTLEAVVRCYALASNGDELIDGADLLSTDDDEGTPMTPEEKRFLGLADDVTEAQKLVYGDDAKGLLAMPESDLLK